MKTIIFFLGHCVKRIDDNSEMAPLSKQLIIDKSEIAYICKRRNLMSGEITQWVVKNDSNVWSVYYNDWRFAEFQFYNEWENIIEQFEGLDGDEYVEIERYTPI